MASPHVAGLAAYFISEYGLEDPHDVADKIEEYATLGAISKVPYLTPNKLISNSPRNSSDGDDGMVRTKRNITWD